METLELPNIEERTETLSLNEVPPVSFAEREIDIAAFKLWQEASRLESAIEEDVTPDGR